MVRYTSDIQFMLCNMENTPTLIYVLEQQIGLCPAASGCNSCLNVEYIYFTGVVCHVVAPEVDAGGICMNYQKDVK